MSSKYHFLTLHATNKQQDTTPLINHSLHHPHSGNFTISWNSLPLNSENGTTIANSSSFTAAQRKNDSGAVHINGNQIPGACLNRIPENKVKSFRFGQLIWHNAENSSHIHLNHSDEGIPIYLNPETGCTDREYIFAILIPSKDDLVSIGERGVISQQNPPQMDSSPSGIGPQKHTASQLCHQVHQDRNCAFLRVWASQKWSDVWKHHFQQDGQDNLRSLSISRVWNKKFIYQNVTNDDDRTVEEIFGTTRPLGQELLVIGREGMDWIQKNSKIGDSSPLFGQKRLWKSRFHRGEPLISRKRIAADVQSGTPSKKPTHTPGICGLNSLGNTCYMNSGIQALSTLPDLREFFLSGAFKQQINTRNSFGTKGKVAYTFASLLRDMWSGAHDSIYPREFKRVIAEHLDQQYASSQQQDASELLRRLITALHEDLNMAKSGNTSVEEDSSRMDETSDEEPPSTKSPADDLALSRAEWTREQQHDQSFVFSQFCGQLRDVITCKQCQHRAVNFSSTMMLPLSIPTAPQEFKVTFHTRDRSSPPSVYCFNFQEPDSVTISNLRQELSTRCGIKSNQLLITTVKEGQIKDYHLNDVKLSDLSIQNGEELVAYQMEHLTNQQHEEGYFIASAGAQSFVEVRFALRNLSDSYNATLIPFEGMHPLLVPFKMDETNQEDIYNFVWAYLKPLYNEKVQEMFDFSTPELFFPYDRTRTKLPELTSRNEDSLTGKQHTRESHKNLFELAIGDSIRGMRANQTSAELDYDNTLLSDTHEKHLSQISQPLRINCITDRYIAIDIMNRQAVNARNHVEASGSSAVHNITLQDCFDQLSLPNTLEYKCEKCSKKSPATSRTSLWKSPPVLVVMLKRFRYHPDGKTAEKISAKVHAPFDLNLNGIIPPEADHSGCNDFSLQSVITHYGTLNYGHYTCCTNHNGKWILFNDHQTKEISTKEVEELSQSAYVLVYTRKTDTKG